MLPDKRFSALLIEAFGARGVSNGAEQREHLIEREDDDTRDPSLRCVARKQQSLVVLPRARARARSLAARSRKNGEKRKRRKKKKRGGGGGEKEKEKRRRVRRRSMEFSRSANHA